MRKTNSEIMYEIALKTVNIENSIDLMLKESSIRSILLEELTDSDVEKLRTAVSDAVQALDKNISSASSNGLGSLAGYLEKIKAALSKANQLAAEIDLKAPADKVADKIKSFFGKKIDITRAMQAIVDLQNKANTAAATVNNTFDLLVKNLESVEVSDDVKLGELKKDRDGIDAEQLKGAVKKAFEAGKPKGFMAKVSALFGKLKAPEIPGAEDVEEFPHENLADDISKLTFKEFKEMAEVASKAAEEAEKAAIPADTVKNIATPPKEAEKSDEESGGGEEVSKDAAAESDPSKAIKDVASDAKSKPMGPKSAVAQALKDWEDGLPPSAQDTLSRKDRGGKLSDEILAGIDKAAKEIEVAVDQSIAKWRSENEETLLKSKRFSKKSFDSLQSMVPKLASQVLQQAQESKFRKVSKREINRFVKRSLDRKFKASDVLYEKWQKNAGLLKG